MIRLQKWEAITTTMIQLLLWILIPWQTETRGDVALCLIVLGVCAVSILGIVEWFIEHVLNIELPG